MSGKKRAGYKGASCVCPGCSDDARFVNRRGKKIKTLMGEIPLQRPYYHCAECGTGRFPWDETLGLTSSGYTPAAQEVITMAGTLVSFPKASEETLRKLSGLRASESTVLRVTEDAGERLKGLRQQRRTLGRDRRWTWQLDARGRTCGYVSIDAVSVRQQGPGGAKAEGRMAYVTKLYSARMREDVPPPPRHQVRYLAGFHELDALGLQLRRQAGQVGWDETEQQIALSDGGSGLEEFLRKNFPLAVCILDFWHAKEHLVELAAVWFGPDEAARQPWLDEQCRRLKHEGGQAVLNQLEAMDLTGRNAAIREAHREQTQYFRNHVHKMDYPTYRRNGWQIGSGPVEAA